MVIGHNYTSNLAKLLKHTPKLSEIQAGRPVGPVMIHIAPTNVCNLKCSFCCYGTRDLRQKLTLDQIRSVLVQFALLPHRPFGVEFTGGGEPTLHQELGLAIGIARVSGYKVGLITNGLSDRFRNYDQLDWCRLSLHALDEGMSLDKSVDRIRSIAPNIDLSSVYIWNGAASERNFQNVVDFTERHKIPTRVTPDLTVGRDNIPAMMEYVGRRIKESGGNYVFLSDFNIQTKRRNNDCWMHKIKPFVFSDGNVYACPSASLSPENGTNVNEKFKVCSIEHIYETYSKPLPVRIQDCQFCKYACQNEFISELTRTVTHPDFA